MWSFKFLPVIVCLVVCGNVHGAVLGSAKAIGKWVLRGDDFVLTHGDDVLDSIKAITKVPYKELKRINLKLTTPGTLINLARLRNPELFSKQFSEVWKAQGWRLKNAIGVLENLLLMSSDNIHVAKGAYGEIKRGIFFSSIEGVTCSKFRHIVQTELGATDIDIVLTYQKRRILIESKEYSQAPSLTEDFRLKIDKYALIEKELDRIPVISLGPDAPSEDFMTYARQRGVHVLHGSLTQQRKMLLEILE